MSLAVLLALIGPSPTAAAHEQLLRSDPAAGSTVTGPVEVIRLTFSDTISPRFAAATFAVDDQPSRPVAATVDGATLTVVPAVPSTTTRQRWTLTYRIVSSDGHPVVDEITFTVTPATGLPDRGASPSPAASLPPAVADNEPAPRWPVAGAVLLVITMVAITVRRRVPPETSNHPSGSP